MMMASKSYEKHPAHQDLYDALIKSLFVDEYDMDQATVSMGESAQFKIKHDDQDEDYWELKFIILSTAKPRKEMDLETTQTTTTTKLPLLKQGEYDMWRLRIDQYFQVQNYSLWDVIENGNSFKPAVQTTTNANGSSTTLVPGPYKDAKTLFAAIQTRFGGNEATKKTQKTFLKQCKRTLVLQAQSLLSLFLTGFRRLNKPDLDTISFDDLYNNFKIVEEEVKGTTSSELAEEPRDKEVDELSQEELQQMMIIVLEQGMNVEALKTNSSCVYGEGNRHLHAGREGVSIVKGNSYVDAGSKALDPTVGSDQGKENKRPRNDTQPSKKSSASKESSNGNTPPKSSKSGKYVTAEEPNEEHVHDMSMNAEENIVDEMANVHEHPDGEGDQCPSDLSKPLPLKVRPGHLTVASKYFFNNDLEYLKSTDSERKYTTSFTKMKTTRYELVGIDDMIPKQQSLSKFSKHDVYSPLKILSLVSVKVNQLHGYGCLDEIVVRRADRQLYKFKEGMPRRKWSVLDKRRSSIMVDLIDQQMLERQILRNLESVDPF
ncbi:hypothetical protein Tco_0294375 [Tanacetum coccineum]